MISTAGLVNYFGRANNLQEINISPLLLVKGKAKLALYGLSAVKDDRLFRLFREEKVIFKFCLAHDLKVLISLWGL
jgi:double-strand break repair protein MRE11